jgi:hypothetical protein
MIPPGAAAPRFLCDEMLQRLARWLRAAGYDAASPAPGTGDAALLDAALADRRLLLTRDRGLCDRRAARADPGAWGLRAGAAGGRLRRVVLLIEGDDITAQAGSLSRQVPVDWALAPMTRCLVCNVPLAPASEAQAAAAPPAVHARGLSVTACPACARIYWPGGHEARIRRTLGHLAARFNGLDEQG